MATVTTTIKLDDQMTGALKQIYRQLEKTDKEIQKTQKSSVAFGVVFGNIITGLLSKVGDLAMKIPEIGDAYRLAQARLGLIAKEGEQVVDINNAIFKSAQASRSSYQATADSVAKLGLLAQDSFSNTAEIIKFSELMSKSFKIGGAALEEQNAAMYQLTQAMAAGKLQGDEFRSVMENAPMLAQSIADYMGKTKGELKEMSSQGVITADIIKEALFESTEDIEKQFEKLPRTWGDTMTMLENQFTMAFGDMLGYLSGTFASGIYEVITFIMSNLDAIIPILIGIAVVIGAAIIPNLLAMIPLIMAQAIGWAIVHLPILIVAAAIVVVLMLLLKFPEVIGMVVGAANALFHGFINVIKGIGNAIIDMVNFVINALNKIPGVNLQPVGKFIYDNLDDAYKEGSEATKGLSDKLKSGLDKITSPFTGGAGAGNSFLPIDGIGGGYGGYGGGTSLDDLGKGIGGINDKLSGKGSLKSAGEVEITDDNLKWLLDIADIRHQQEYQQTPIVVNISTGDINSGTDENRLFRKFEDVVVNAFNNNLGTGEVAL